MIFLFFIINELERNEISDLQESIRTLYMQEIEQKLKIII